MAQPSKSLYFLLSFFLFLIVAAGTFIGWNEIEKRKATLHAEIKTIQTAIAENDQWMNQAQMWKQREDWITTNQPTTAGADDASLSLIEGIQKSAQENNIQITDQKILTTQTTPNFFSTSVKVKVVTDMKSLINWLYLLQTPASFTLIDSFSLKTDAQSSNLACELTIVRWYSPKFKKP